MLTLREFAMALAGIMRLVRLDAQGLAFFGNDATAFWRSFSAAMLVAPVHFALVFLDLPVEIAARPLHTSLVQAIAYVIAWVAYPLAMVHISRFLGRESLFFRYMAAYNWFQVAQAAIVLPASLLAATGLLSNDAIALLGLFVLSAILMYDWFIARSALGVDGAQAAALVTIDLLLGLLISGAADSLL